MRVDGYGMQEKSGRGFSIRVSVVTARRVKAPAFGRYHALNNLMLHYAILPVCCGGKYFHASYCVVLYCIICIVLHLL